jgi:predicted RNA-binding protein with PIN domain
MMLARMPYLIDGDNLLGTWRGRERTPLERRGLATELARFGARLRRRVVVVFDGTARDGLQFGADVHFAGPTHTADQRILELLRREEHPKGWTVVTSDRSLGDRCRWLGARVERSDLFRKRLSAQGTGEKPERETELDYWLEQFDDEGGA